MQKVRLSNVQFIGSVFGYIIYYGYKLTGLYVIGLILFTVAVKVAMFPLSVKQQKSMAKQARLAPKLKEIQERCGNDRERYNQETMALYQREGTSPTSGCLPLLIQFPIIIGLYEAIRSPLTCVLHMGKEAVNKLLEITQVAESTNYYKQIEMIKSFNSLSDSQMSKINAMISDNLMTQGNLEDIQTLANGGFNCFGLDLLGVPEFFNWLLLIPVLCFVSSMFMSFYTNKTSSSAQNSGVMMKWGMPLFMSFFTSYIAYTVPGAVGFYWFLSNVVSILQSVVLNKFYNANIMGAKEEAARIRRRELEEEKILELHPNFSLQRATKRLIDAEERKAAQNAQATAVPVKEEPSVEVTDKRNDKVIKTGNAARAGNTSKKKK